MGKLEETIQAIKDNPEWTLRQLRKNLKVGERTISRAREILGMGPKRNGKRKWTEQEDKKIIWLRVTEKLSWPKIAEKMGIHKWMVRERFIEIRSITTGITTPDPDKILEMRFIWKPGPLVPYVPVFGR